MNHYETLGLARDASADDIKQAYRRRASAAHPDRGGSADDMAAVNRAHEVLGDPTRRARYDATGQDTEPTPLADEARAVLIQLFQKCMDASPGRFLVQVSAEMRQLRSVAQAGLTQMETKEQSLQRRRACVSTTDGALNLAHMVIDQQLLSLKRSREQLEHGLLVLDEVGRQLERHQSTELAPSPPTAPAYSADPSIFFSGNVT